MALPSSLTCKPKFKYDVFLSFRGKDTRYAFTGNLYFSLLQKGINTFMDDEELGRGEQISPAILKAIEESKIAMVVFSKNFASSPWCLDELVKILECMKQQNQLVFPIFYKVEPSTIRHQLNSYGDAIAKHEKRFKDEMDKVQKWRSALFEASNLSGWELKSGYEFQFIEKITEVAFAKLNSKHLYVDGNLVGLKSLIKEVNSILDIESDKDSFMVGIYGPGGIGKTTLAQFLYDMIVDQFECSCFLVDVREISYNKGLLKLQKTLLANALGKEYVKLSNVYEGIRIIRDRLQFKRVLLVLDDVDKLEQLQWLAGKCDWFGFGSRIIITTRNRHLLIAHQIQKTYQMKELNDHDALELLSWSAFKRMHPPSSHLNISESIVHYAKGLPLALKVIGSDLFGKSLVEWECALDKYKRIPNGELQRVLRISYDNLEENEKNIFLDIACFFKGEKLEYVKKVLDACNFYPQFGIGVLVDKCLISIEDDSLRMHDLIRDMGREIIRNVSPLEPGRRSRLWFHEDVLEVLTQDTGTANVEGIMLDLLKSEKVFWSGTAFKKMKNLRILIIRNVKFSIGPEYLPNNIRCFEWKEYPSKYFPTSFHPKKLVAFNVPSSCINLDKPFKEFQFLVQVDFSDCLFLTQIPDFCGVPNLQRLWLKNCTNLVKVHDSIGFLSELVELELSGCRRLELFPNILGKMEKLSFISLGGTAIAELPDLSGAPNLRHLYLIGCENLVKVHDSIGFLSKLVNLSFSRCYKLKHCPHSFHLKSLEYLNLSNCRRLELFPNILGKMEKLSDAQLTGSAIKELPDSLGCLTGLIYLYDTACKFVRNLASTLFMQPHFSEIDIQDSPQLVKSLVQVDEISSPSLRYLNLDNCSVSEDDLRMIFNSCPKLKHLKLRGNNLERIPTSIKNAVNLESLHVDDCKRLREIPEIPSNLQNIMARNCKSLTSDSSSRLWSQAFKEVQELEVRMTTTNIPEWFDHCIKGETMSFWVRKKFPVVAIAFVFKNLDQLENQSLSQNEDTYLAVQFFINGNKVLIEQFDDTIVGGNVRLFSFNGNNWDRIDASLTRDWNYVEIRCINRYPILPKPTIEYIGVHVYKQKTNMEDIQFHCPVNLSKQPASILSPQHGQRINPVIVQKFEMPCYGEELRGYLLDYT